MDTSVKSGDSSGPQSGEQITKASKCIHFFHNSIRETDI